MGKFATFLIGGAVGAVAGLLLSPRSGAENRALLSEVANEKCGTVSCPPQLQEKAGRFVEAAASTSTKVIKSPLRSRTTKGRRRQKICEVALLALLVRARFLFLANHVDFHGLDLNLFDFDFFVLMLHNARPEPKKRQP